MTNLLGSRRLNLSLHMVDGHLTGAHKINSYISWGIDISLSLVNKTCLYMYIYIFLFQKIQFSMSTQFNCQKHFYFKRFSLFKQF